MPCYHPRKAIRDSDGVRFVAAKMAYTMRLPCGQCIGCRLEQSRQKAVRCMHEASMHRQNCFITLTIAPEHMHALAPTGSLDKRHHQLFLKRLLSHRRREQLRGAAAPRPTNNVSQNRSVVKQRFYMCGEYGEQLRRPHYHFCIFGYDFHDKKHWSTTKAGSKLYRSTTLEKLWPYGHSTVGELTFESAAYTARYCTKKITGKKQQKHYEKINPETGEITNLLPEYNEMSRRPGIGKNWIEKYTADVYTALPGKVIVRGKTANAPRYYDKQLEKWDAEKYEIIKHKRKIEGRKQAQHGTQARLAVREAVAKAKLTTMKRTI